MHELKHGLFQVQMVDRNDWNELQHEQGNESINEEHHGAISDHGQESPTLEELGGRGIHIENSIDINIRGTTPKCVLVHFKFH